MRCQAMLKMPMGHWTRPPKGHLMAEAYSSFTSMKLRTWKGKNHTNPSVRLLFNGEERKTKLLGHKKERSKMGRRVPQFMLDVGNDRVHVKVTNVSKRSLLHQKETLGYVGINLLDVVSNRRINERYHLGPKNGRIQIEMQWRTSS